VATSTHAKNEWNIKKKHSPIEEDLQLINFFIFLLGLKKKYLIQKSLIEYIFLNLLKRLI
jgi:hypothetical protein